MPEPTLFWAIALLAVTCGALVQGSVGFGVGLIAAPFLMWTIPESVPVSLLILGGVMASITLISEWRSIDARGVAWALLGRLPGVVVGAGLLLVASGDLLGVLIGLTVVFAAALQWWRWIVPRTNANLVAAGAIAGVTGTISGIGGPPLAMVYAGQPGPRVRASLAAYFTVGSIMSLAGLGLSGQVQTESFFQALLLLPALVVGAVLARPLARFLDSGRTRRSILIVAGISGLVLAVTSALGL